MRLNDNLSVDIPLFVGKMKKKKREKKVLK
jgi:hypothetical protein